jgi:outer membrane protein OmpA-like peptidoglycan-associated protein
MRITRVGLLAGALAVCALPAHAQDTDAVHLDRYRPAPSVDDGFAISRPDDRGHLLFGARLDLDYALNPLVVEDLSGDASTERGALVEHSLAAHLNLSLGLFERLVLFVGLPVGFVQEGEPILDLPAGDGTALGDLFVGARGRLFGEPGEIFALGLQLTVTFPTATAANQAQRYSGESGATFWPQLLLELRPVDILRITGNVGARFRTDAPGTIVNLDVGHELTWGANVTVTAIEDLLDIHFEGWGSAIFDTIGNDGARVGTPFEVLGGLRFHPVRDLDVGIAAGTGLTRGYGSPDFRAVLTVGWAQRPIRDPGALVDTDRDGLTDDVDECPTEPEDPDGFRDEDGCPEADNDSDGVLDNADQCPTEAEDVDNFEDENGCPDPDNDQDGVLDGADGCPIVPEDADGFDDQDGCPDADNDGDGIMDVEDRCPNEAGIPELQGCPPQVEVEVESGEIRVLQRVEFETDSDVILQSSEAILQDVHRILAESPQMELIRVEGHTDDRDHDSHNMDLSRRRARSVVFWLIDHGIAATRLQAWGCGEIHPLQSNETEEGMQANRRVEFHILRPVPPQGLRTLRGCRRITLGRR